MALDEAAAAEEVAQQAAVENYHEQMDIEDWLAWDLSPEEKREILQEDFPELSFGDLIGRWDW